MHTKTNKVMLTGLLSKDPIIKIYENGSRKAILLIAVSESYVNQAGRKIRCTHWHRIIAWGRVADQVGRMLHKGTRISMEGRLRPFYLHIHEAVYPPYQEIIMDEFEIHLDIQERTMLRA